MLFFANTLGSLIKCDSQCNGYSWNYTGLEWFEDVLIASFLSLNSTYILFFLCSYSGSQIIRSLWESIGSQWRLDTFQPNWHSSKLMWDQSPSKPSKSPLIMKYVSSWHVSRSTVWGHSAWHPLDGKFLSSSFSRDETSCSPRGVPSKMLMCIMGINLIMPRSLLGRRSLPSSVSVTIRTGISTPQAVETLRSLAHSGFKSSLWKSESLGMFSSFPV